MLGNKELPTRDLPKWVEYQMRSEKLRTFLGPVFQGKLRTRKSQRAALLHFRVWDVTYDDVKNYT